jgi:predicted aldo/keto reductase-like oxidoreductase
LQQCRAFSYWYDWFENNPKTSPLEICLDYVFKLKNIDRIVIGIENLQHLNEILKAFESNKIKKYNYDSNIFKCEDLMIVDPSNWQKI